MAGGVSLMVIISGRRIIVPGSHQPFLETCSVRLVSFLVPHGLNLIKCIIYWFHIPGGLISTKDLKYISNHIAGILFLFKLILWELHKLEKGNRIPEKI
jgi:hypothetical protein